MTKVKIITALVVVGFIVFFLVKSIVQSPKDVAIERPPTNQFTTRIEKEIDSLSKAPITVFCKQSYEDIRYRINDYYKQKFLGETAKDNEQWKEILSKNLYTAYAPKFAEQALYVFNGSEWLTTDLNFIRKEVNVLQRSNYLEGGSTVDSSFSTIRTVLSKYDEIAGFVAGCNSFTYSDYAIASHFPLSEVSEKIQRAVTYISNELDNVYVNNCTRLKDGLRGVPEKLFGKHFNYMDSKIRNNSDRFRIYDYQSDYSKEIYIPLKTQVEELTNEVYGVGENTIETSQTSLMDLLTIDNRNATDYILSKRNN